MPRRRIVKHKPITRKPRPMFMSKKAQEAKRLRAQLKRWRGEHTLDQRHTADNAKGLGG